jgi:hypothetical protein
MDPHSYFGQEEPALAVRAFTRGYDLFHPNRHIAWHHYYREGQPRHWNDHTQDAAKTAEVDEAWIAREQRARLRLQQLFGQVDHGIDLGEFGLGQERTLRDYERYAGIDFKGWRLHRATRENLPPPVQFLDEIVWESEMRTFVRRHAPGLGT